MSSSSSRSPSPASSSSSGLYVPVHRRSSSGSSTSGFSSRSSISSESDSSIAPPALPTFIYSRDSLLNLANSPLARLTPEARDSLRGDVPEIITNRRQRKAIEFHNQAKHMPPTTPRRIRPVPTTARPNQRKRNASQVVDTVAWRQPSTIPIAV